MSGRGGAAVLDAPALRAPRPVGTAVTDGSEPAFAARRVPECPVPADVFAADGECALASDVELPASADAKPVPVHAAAPIPIPAAPTVNHRSTAKFAARRRSECAPRLADITAPFERLPDNCPGDSSPPGPANCRISSRVHRNQRRQLVRLRTRRPSWLLLRTTMRAAEFRSSHIVSAAEEPPWRR